MIGGDIGCVGTEHCLNCELVPVGGHTHRGAGGPGGCAERVPGWGLSSSSGLGVTASLLMVSWPSDARGNQGSETQLDLGCSGSSQGQVQPGASACLSDSSSGLQVLPRTGTHPRNPFWGQATGRRALGPQVVQ